MEASGGNPREGRRLTVCQPEILLSLLSLEAADLSASLVLLKKNCCINLFKINTFGQLTARLVVSFTIWAFMTCCRATVQPEYTPQTSQWCCRTQLCSFACLWLTLYAKEVVLTWPKCADCCNGLSLVDKLLMEQVESLTLTCARILCGRKKTI